MCWSACGRECVGQYDWWISKPCPNWKAGSTTGQTGAACGGGWDSWTLLAGVLTWLCVGGGERVVDICTGWIWWMWCWTCIVRGICGGAPTCALQGATELFRFMLWLGLRAVGATIAIAGGAEVSTSKEFSPCDSDDTISSADCWKYGRMVFGFL